MWARVEDGCVEETLNTLTIFLHHARAHTVRVGLP